MCPFEWTNGLASLLVLTKRWAVGVGNPAMAHAVHAPPVSPFQVPIWTGKKYWTTPSWDHAPPSTSHLLCLAVPLQRLCGDLQWSCSLFPFVSCAVPPIISLSNRDITYFTAHACRVQLPIAALLHSQQ
jgi:hypothetical protein